MEKWLRKVVEQISNKSKLWKASVLSLAAVVVFVTTYALILPAITLEREEAQEMSGIDIEVSEAVDFSTEDVEYVEASDGQAFAAAPVEETDFSSGENDFKLASSPILLDTDEYHLQISFTGDALLPEGVVPELLTFSEEETDVYREETEQKAEETYPGSTVTVAGFHKIRLVKDGNIVIPSAPVDIRIDYLKHTNQHPDEKALAVLFTGDENSAALYEKNADGSETVVLKDEIISSLELKQYTVTNDQNVFGFLCLSGVDEELSDQELSEEEASDTNAAYETFEEPKKEQMEESSEEISEKQTEKAVQEESAFEGSDENTKDLYEEESKEDSKQAIEQPEEMTSEESQEAVGDDAENTEEASENNQEKAVNQSEETMEEAQEETEEQTEEISEEEQEADAENPEESTDKAETEKTPETGTYGIVGGSEVYLSEVLDNLTDEAASDISLDEIKYVSFSDDSLFEAIETGDGDWIVNSRLSEEDVSLESEEDRQQEMTLELEDRDNVSVGLQIEGVESTEDPLISISSVDGVFLPEEADGYGEVLSNDDAEYAVSVVKDYVSTQSGTADEAGEETSDNTSDTITDNTQTEYQVFDISLNNVNYEEYEQGFQVTVNLPENITAKDFHLYHLHGDVEEIDLRIVQESIDGNGNIEASGFTFVTENFSEFVLSYTVDFHYNGYEFSIPGEGSILLSEVFEELQIEKSAADAVEVTFSDETLLSIEKEENDWRLTSLAPFLTDETLEILFADGSKLELLVTDAQTIVLTDDYINERIPGNVEIPPQIIFPNNPTVDDLNNNNISGSLNDNDNVKDLIWKRAEYSEEDNSASITLSYFQKRYGTQLDFIFVVDETCTMIDCGANVTIRIGQTSYTEKRAMWARMATLKASKALLEANGDGYGNRVYFIPFGGIQVNASGFFTDYNEALSWFNDHPFIGHGTNHNIPMVAAYNVAKTSRSQGRTPVVIYLTDFGCHAEHITNVNRENLESVALVYPLLIYPEHSTNSYGRLKFVTSDESHWKYMGNDTANLINLYSEIIGEVIKYIDPSTKVEDKLSNSLISNTGSKALTLNGTSYSNQGVVTWYMRPNGGTEKAYENGTVYTKMVNIPLKDNIIISGAMPTNQGVLVKNDLTELNRIDISPVLEKSVGIIVRGYESKVFLNGAAFHLVNNDTNQIVWSGTTDSNGKVSIPYTKEETEGGNGATFAANSSYTLKQDATDTENGYVVPSGEWKLVVNETYNIQPITISSDDQPYRTLDAAIEKGFLLIYNEKPLHVYYHSNFDTEDDETVEIVEIPLGSSAYTISHDKPNSEETLDFHGWDTDKNGAGMPNGTVLPVGKEDIHLYAIWKPATEIKVPVHVVIRKGNEYELKDELRKTLSDEEHTDSPTLELTVGRENVLIPANVLDSETLLSDDVKEDYLFYQFGYGPDENHITLTDNDFIGTEKGFLLTDDGLKYLVSSVKTDGRLWGTNQLYMVYYPAKVTLHVMHMTQDGDTDWNNDMREDKDADWRNEDCSTISVSNITTLTEADIPKAIQEGIEVEYAYQFVYVQDKGDQKAVQITSLQNSPEGIHVNGDQEIMVGYDVWQVYYSNPHTTVPVYWVERLYTGDEGVSVKLLNAEDPNWYGSDNEWICNQSTISKDPYVIRADEGSEISTPLRLPDEKGKFHLTAYAVGPDYGVLKSDEADTFSDGQDIVLIGNGSIYHAGEAGIVLRNTQFGLECAVDSGKEQQQSFEGSKYYSDVAIYIIYEMEAMFDVKKVDIDDLTALPDAEFALTRSETENGIYSVYTGENETNNRHITAADGSMHLHLIDGYYKLTEESAPGGYVIHKKEITFSVSNGSVTLLGDCSVQGDSSEKWAWIQEYDGYDDFETSSDEYLVIANKKGAELPSTGGSGTLPYTLSGLALLASAAMMYGFGMRRRERRSN